MDEPPLVETEDGRQEMSAAIQTVDLEQLRGGPTGIYRSRTGFRPVMRRLSLLVAILALCAGILLGSNWAGTVPVAVGITSETVPVAVGEETAESDGSATTELRAPIDHRAEGPARAIRIEAPERSLFETRVLPATAAPISHLQRAGLPTVSEHRTLARAQAPARHLELCVFLC